MKTDILILFFRSDIEKYEDHKLLVELLMRYLDQVLYKYKNARIKGDERVQEQATGYFIKHFKYLQDDNAQEEWDRILRFSSREGFSPVLKNSLGEFYSDINQEKSVRTAFNHEQKKNHLHLMCEFLCEDKTLLCKITKHLTRKHFGMESYTKFDGDGYHLLTPEVEASIENCALDKHEKAQKRVKDDTKKELTCWLTKFKEAKNGGDEKKFRTTCDVFIARWKYLQNETARYEWEYKILPLCFSQAFNP
jgi:hypothetical protein